LEAASNVVTTGSNNWSKNADVMLV